RHYPSEHPDWEPPTWPHQMLDATLRIDPGFPDPVPGYPLPSDTPRRDSNLPSDSFEGWAVQEDLLPEDLPEDPFPEHNAVHFPLSEDDLPDYVLFPDDSMPGRPLPQDPYSTWAAQNWSALTTVGRTAEL
ncbi:MAG: hypothetical protein ABI568_02720, partial [Pseudarthrobacter sp.]